MSQLEVGADVTLQDVFRKVAALDEALRDERVQREQDMTTLSKRIDDKVAISAVDTSSTHVGNDMSGKVVKLQEEMAVEADAWKKNAACIAEHLDELVSELADLSSKLSKEASSRQLLERILTEEGAAREDEIKCLTQLVSGRKSPDGGCVEQQQQQLSSSEWKEAAQRIREEHSSDVRDLREKLAHEATMRDRDCELLASSVDKKLRELGKDLELKFLKAKVAARSLEGTAEVGSNSSSADALGVDGRYEKLVEEIKACRSAGQEMHDELLLELANEAKAREHIARRSDKLAREVSSWEAPLANLTQQLAEEIDARQLREEMVSSTASAQHDELVAETTALREAHQGFDELNDGHLCRHEELVKEIENWKEELHLKHQEKSLEQSQLAEQLTNQLGIHEQQYNALTNDGNICRDSFAAELVEVKHILSQFTCQVSDVTEAQQRSDDGHSSSLRKHREELAIDIASQVQAAVGDISDHRRSIQDTSAWQEEFSAAYCQFKDEMQSEHRAHVIHTNEISSQQEACSWKDVVGELVTQQQFQLELSKLQLTHEAAIPQKQGGIAASSDVGVRHARAEILSECSKVVEQFGYDETVRQLYEELRNADIHEESEMTLKFLHVLTGGFGHLSQKIDNEARVLRQELSDVAARVSENSYELSSLAVHSLLSGLNINAGEVPSDASCLTQVSTPGNLDSELRVLREDLSTEVATWKETARQTRQELLTELSSMSVQVCDNSKELSSIAVHSLLTGLNRDNGDVPSDVGGLSGADVAGIAGKYLFQELEVSKQLDDVDSEAGALKEVLAELSRVTDYAVDEARPMQARQDGVLASELSRTVERLDDLVRSHHDMNATQITEIRGQHDDLLGEVTARLNVTQEQSLELTGKLADTIRVCQQQADVCTQDNAKQLEEFVRELRPCIECGELAHEFSRFSQQLADEDVLRREQSKVSFDAIGAKFIDVNTEIAAFKESLVSISQRQEGIQSHHLTLQQEELANSLAAWKEEVQQEFYTEFSKVTVQLVDNAIARQTEDATPSGDDSKQRADRCRDGASWAVIARKIVRLPHAVLQTQYCYRLARLPLCLRKLLPDGCLRGHGHFSSPKDISPA